ncbi:Kiwa anti-phage protein KwaB-like domain-containing protein, partial [Bacillus subtilis]
YHDRSFMRRLSQIRSSTLVSNGSITIQMVDAVRQKFPVFQRNLNVTNGFIDMTTKEHKRYFIRLLNNEASFAALNQEPFLAVDKDSAA